MDVEKHCLIVEIGNVCLQTSNLHNILKNFLHQDPYFNTILATL